MPAVLPGPTRRGVGLSGIGFLHPRSSAIFAREADAARSVIESYGRSMTSSPTSRQIPSVTITPAEPNLDTELTISLAGLPPDTRVTLRATQPGRDGRVWSAALDADTDAHGTAELIPHRDDPMAL